MRETTALGAAIAAGFAVEVWTDFQELNLLNRTNRTVFHPRISAQQRDNMFRRWQRAVQMAKGWIDPSESRS